MVAFLRPLDSNLSISLAPILPWPGVFLEEEVSASVLELAGAWGLSQLV